MIFIKIYFVTLHGKNGSPLHNLNIELTSFLQIQKYEFFTNKKQ